MATRMVTVNSLKPGSFVIIDGAPCKVLSITTSSPGKHGAAKARIVAIGLIDGKRRETIKGTDDKIEAPIIEKKTGQVIYIQREGEKMKVQVMDMETYETFEAEVEDELKEKISEGIEVEYWDIMGYKVVKRIRS